MSKEIVYSNQNFFNKVIECTGDIDNAFEMMLLNNKTTFTNKLEVGLVLKKSKITDYEVVDFFTEINRPSTSVSIISIDNSLDYLFPGEFPFSF
jgi:hypothetical protein